MSAPFNPLAATIAADPYPDYGRLVRERPFARDTDLGLWVAASAEAVEATLLHPALRVRPVAEPVPRALVGTTAGEVFGRLVRMNDGERHCPWKSAISSALATLDLGALAGHAARWAPRTLAAAETTDDGARVDALAFRLPALALGAWLGVGDAALPAVAADAAALATSFGPAATPEAIEHGSRAAARLLDAVERLLAEGRARGALQALATATEHSGVEAQRTLIANAVGFLTQAYEATAGLIGNTLLALAREPAARGTRGRRADLAACVAEVARFDSPVHNTRRFAGEPCMLLGHQLATGDTVLVLLAAANRDPAVNPDPDRFEVGRAAPRMFTFGAGVHACPGAALATTLAAVAVEAILDAGIEPEALERRFTYRSAQNTRVPLFAGAAQRGAA
jgi:cytochrome P450